MYKVLVADDEIIERKGLSKILKKEFNDEIDIIQASNGRIAIKKALEERPDIIFMDIKMPGINGIEAMEKIQEKFNKSNIVVISAYDSFKYAQMALKNNAFEYLLKPVKKKDILNCVYRLMDFIKRKKNNSNKGKNLKEKLIKSDLIIDSKIFDYIKLNQIDKLKIINKKNIVDFNINKGIIVLIEEKEIDNREKIIKYFNSKFKENIKLINNFQLYFIIPEKYIEKVEKINQDFDIMLNYKFQEYNSLNEISTRYYLLNSSNKNDNNEKIYPIALEKDMLSKIDLYLKEDALNLLEKLFYWIDRNIKSDLEKIKYLESINTIVKRKLFEKKEIYEILSVKVINETHLKKKITIIKRNIKNIITRYTNKIEMSPTDDIIDLAKEYIDNNFDKELTLEKIAEEICISSYYFSKLFKEKMNINFIDYLTEIRIKKAKKMLRNSNYIIKKISKDVGYNDPNYFSRVFKKYTGESPSKYRKKY
ncbi:MAG: response regulator transcription factor [Bacillota bacterium]